MNLMEQFKVTIVVMLFYSFCITMMLHVLPSTAQNQITGFYDSEGRFELQTVSDELSDSLERQTQIPVIELGALVFYSGNIILDLLLNFMFAIPQMIGFIITGILMLFGINSELFVFVQLFSSVVITALYVIGLIQLVANLRGKGSLI